MSRQSAWTAWTGAGFRQLLKIVICWCVLVTSVRRRPRQPITSDLRLLSSPIQESTLIIVLRRSHHLAAPSPPHVVLNFDTSLRLVNARLTSTVHRPTRPVDGPETALLPPLVPRAKSRRLCPDRSRPSGLSIEHLAESPFCIGLWYLRSPHCCSPFNRLDHLGAGGCAFAASLLGTSVR